MRCSIVWLNAHAFQTFPLDMQLCAPGSVCVCSAWDWRLSCAEGSAAWRPGGARAVELCGVGAHEPERAPSLRRYARLAFSPSFDAPCAVVLRAPRTSLVNVCSGVYACLGGLVRGERKSGNNLRKGEAWRQIFHCERIPLLKSKCEEFAGIFRVAVGLLFLIPLSCAAQHG